MLSFKYIALAVLICLVGVGCRTSEPSDAERIHAQKSSVLVAWLDWNRLPEDLKDRDPKMFSAICDELAARRDVDFLLASLNDSTNENVRKWLVSDALWQINDTKVYNAFVRRLDDKEDEESYYVALYLAKRGNTAALATLNRHYFQYPISSWEWSGAVELFGKYKYTPATSNLFESLDAASLNVSGAACYALQQIFPGSLNIFYSPKEARDYFLKKLSETSNKPDATNLTAAPR